MTTADQITKMLADMEQVPFEQREKLSKLIGKYKSEMWQAGYTKGIEVATATPPYTVVATAGTYQQLAEKSAA